MVASATCGYVLCVQGRYSTARKSVGERGTDLSRFVVDAKDVATGIETVCGDATDFMGKPS